MIIDRKTISKPILEQTSIILEKIVRTHLETSFFGEFNELFTPIILDLLGENYKAIYWSPAYAPFSDGMSSPGFAKYGRWDMIDKRELPINDKDIYGCFSKCNFIKFDITKTPKFPLDIEKESYDLSFFNYDWAGNGHTYIASDLALMPRGVLMTDKKNLSSINQFSNSKYKLIFDPELDYSRYLILIKQ